MLTFEGVDLPDAEDTGGCEASVCSSRPCIHLVSDFARHWSHLSLFGVENTWFCRDWYVIAEPPAPAPHLAHPEGSAALRIAPVTVPRGSRSCEHFPDGFDLHPLQLEIRISVTDFAK